MPEPTERITRDDIESKLRDIKDVVDGRAVEAKAKAVPVAVAAGVAVVLLVFWLGKRTGRKTSTVVEIRRI